MGTKLGLWVIVAMLIGGIGGYLIGRVNLDASAPVAPLVTDISSKSSSHSSDLELVETISSYASAEEELLAVRLSDALVVDPDADSWVSSAFINCIMGWEKENPRPDENDKEAYEEWLEQGFKRLIECFNLVLGIIAPGATIEGWTDGDRKFFNVCVEAQYSKKPPLSHDQAMEYCVKLVEFGKGRR